MQSQDLFTQVHPQQSTVTSPLFCESTAGLRSHIRVQRGNSNEKEYERKNLDWGINMRSFGIEKVVFVCKEVAVTIRLYIYIGVQRVMVIIDKNGHCEFKSWTRQFAFSIAIMSLGKVWIQLFSFQLWVNSRVDWTLYRSVTVQLRRKYGFPSRTYVV